METVFWLTLGFIFFLLLLSALFSGSETALTAVSHAKLHSLEKEGNERASLVNKLRHEKDKLIGALLLGNNLVNILASSLTTSLLIKMFGEAGVAYATLIMTLLILIFSEVLPKSYAISNSTATALAIAPFINVIVKILSPFTKAIIWFVRMILRVLGVDLQSGNEAGKDELLGVIELHQGEEEEVRHERNMLRSILDLAEVTVEEIMTPRGKVIALDVDLPAETILDDILNGAYTRIPLYQGSQENIVGILHAKALLREWKEKGCDASRINILDISAKPWFIPDTTTLFDQLQEFRARKEHFAIVIDEYGTYEGIVTLEDILEEIVGQIDDEHDMIVEGVKKNSKNQFIVEGSVTIRDLNRDNEWRLPDEDYSTVAGLIINEAKLIPQQGQSFSFFDFRFDVMAKEGNKITKVRITPPVNE